MRTAIRGHGELSATPSLGRYELRMELGRGGTGVVYEAWDRESHATVALKTLVSMDAQSVFRLKHEFRALANLEHENFVRFGELSSVGGQLFFTMERVHGSEFVQYAQATTPTIDGADAKVSFTRRLAGPSFDEPRLRDTLAQLVDALGALHAAGRIHRDVKPSNVLVTNEGRVVLLDFGLTGTLGDQGKAMVGTPAYMAPEQILGEPLTPATDWYAVGLMVYEAITGHLPFSGRTSAMLQAKLTEDALVTFQASVPEDLQALCVALVDRDPSKRPSVDEIRARLGLSRPAGQAREVFVGREQELGRLNEALARAAAVVVCGDAGIGKSALVERFLSELEAKTVVLRGRCYEQERVPFSGVDSLIDALSEYLLVSTEEEMDRLLARGVPNLARMFPVLCRVPAIAVQRVEAPALNAAKLREDALVELAQVMAALGGARTLVLYVDDLQWIDGDGLAVIRLALLAKEARCLFVATMRDGGAVVPAVAEFVEGLERIDLPPLSNEEARDLCGALATIDGEAQERVLREAGGHPLFLTELLRSAGEGKLAEHANARLEDVLWERISERDEVERRFLEMTALAGASTSYAVLAEAADLDVGECATRLSGLRAAQLIRVSRIDEERCVEPYHDRVREAVIERLRTGDDGRIAERHLSLGRALLAATPESKLAARVFTIVQHWNQGRSRLTSDADRRTQASLNLLASRQAYLATAFDRARECAVIGIEGLAQDAWSRDPAMCRDLYIARFAAEYVSLGRDAALATFDTVKRRMETPRDKAAVYVPWIDLEAPNFPQAAVETGCQILRELGSAPPQPTSKLDVLAAYAGARWAQRGRAPEVFEHAPELRDEKRRGVLRILAAMTPAAYFIDENLFSWILLRLTAIAMKEGVSDEAAYAFGGYAIVLAGFGKYAEGAAFGRVARAMARADQNSRFIAKVEMAYPTFLLPWVAPFVEARRALDEAERIAIVHGDTQYRVYTMAARVELDPAFSLDRTFAEATHTRETCLRQGVAYPSGAVVPFMKYATALRGPTMTELGPAPEAATTSDSELLRHHYLTAELGYLKYEDVSVLLGHLGRMKPYMNTAFAAVITVDICFLEALVAARACDSAGRLARAKHVLQVLRAQRRHDVWERNCPTNFESHARIVRAELLRILGRATAASDAYEGAIACAKRVGATKREAIACELAMAHAEKRGDPGEAARYRRLAIDAYRRWGAPAKATALGSQASASAAPGPKTAVQNRSGDLT